jgi:hypothetical protein
MSKKKKTFIIVCGIIVTLAILSAILDDGNKETSASVNNREVEKEKNKDFKDKGGWAFGMRTCRFYQIKSEYEDKGFKLKDVYELPTFQGKKMYMAKFDDGKAIEDTFVLALEKASKRGLDKSKFKIFFYGRSYFGRGEMFDAKQGFGRYTSLAANDLSVDLHNEIVRKVNSAENKNDVVTITEEMKDCKVEVTFAGIKGNLLARNVRIFDKDFNWERDVIQAQ